MGATVAKRALPAAGLVASLLVLAFALLRRRRATAPAAPVVINLTVPAGLLPRVAAAPLEVSHG